VVAERSPVAGQTLMEARIPQRTGLIVIALRKRADARQAFVFNPVGDTKLEAGDEVIVLGKEEQVSALRQLVE